MPGLRLTEAQAQRLWGLESALCSALLSTLIDTRFLFRTREGAFIRIEHATPLRASLVSRTKGFTAALSTPALAFSVAASPSRPQLQPPVGSLDLVLFGSIASASVFGPVGTFSHYPRKKPRSSQTLPARHLTSAVRHSSSVDALALVWQLAVSTHPSRKGRVETGAATSIPTHV